MEKVTSKRILVLWFPLLLTWFMMSMEGPFLSAVIARSDNYVFNLAAFGVAFSLALIAESPIIMILSAAVALVKGKNSFHKLSRFTLFLNIMVTLFTIFFIIPPVFDFIAIKVLSIPEEVADLTFIALIIMIPWSAAIGYRRLYQGILINNGETRKIAYGTIFRLTSMVGTALVLFNFTSVSGVSIGASALTIGVIVEAVATRIMAIGAVRNTLSVTDDKDISYREISIFYYPLILTSFITLAARPAIVFFLGRSFMSIESLAIWPVITSFMFIFAAVGLSFQEVGIVMISEKLDGYKPVRNFALCLAFSAMAIYTAVVFTPLSDLWFRVVSGLSTELSIFAVTPAQIFFLMPALTVILSFQRSLMVVLKKTKAISIATTLELIGIVVILYPLIFHFNMIGAVAAATAAIIGRLLANGWLIKSFVKSAKEIT